MESNESFDDSERLLELGFTLAQIEQLQYLRNVYPEVETIFAEQRRLEFARWLVLNGRLTDELPNKQHGSLGVNMGGEGWSGQRLQEKPYRRRRAEVETKHSKRRI